MAWVVLDMLSAVQLDGGQDDDPVRGRGLIDLATFHPPAVHWASLGVASILLEPNLQGCALRRSGTPTSLLEHIC